MRNASHELVLDTAGVTANGKATLCNDPQARYITYGVNVSVTAQTLAGNITLYGSADPVGPDDQALMFALTTPTLYSPAITGAAMSGGVLTFATTFLAVGTHRFMIRLADPPPVVLPRFTFTSGGGTVRVRVKAVY